MSQRRAGLGTERHLTQQTTKRKAKRYIFRYNSSSQGIHRMTWTTKCSLVYSYETCWPGRCMTLRESGVLVSPTASPCLLNEIVRIKCLLYSSLQIAAFVCFLYVFHHQISALTSQFSHCGVEGLAVMSCTCSYNCIATVATVGSKSCLG